MSSDMELYNTSTGDNHISEAYVIREVPFDRYMISVRLSPDGKFLGISEVKIDQDFRSIERLITRNIRFHIGAYEPTE